MRAAAVAVPCAAMAQWLWLLWLLYMTAVATVAAVTAVAAVAVAVTLKKMHSCICMRINDIGAVCAVA
jgi:hypothetical protein